MEREFRALLAAGLPGVPVGRINWGEHPQDMAGPYVVLHMISRTGGHTQQGPNGLWQSRVQVDCWSPRFLEMLDMGGAVIRTLDGHRGGLFQGIFFSSMTATREDDENAGEPIFRARLDFTAHWRENHG